MIKTYEIARKICTEQLYSLLVFPWIRKYKSKLSLLLPYYFFLFLFMCVCCGTFDIHVYHLSLFASIV